MRSSAIALPASSSRAIRSVTQPESGSQWWTSARPSAIRSSRMAARPLRTTVGPNAEGAAILNQTSAAVQQELLQALGLGDLLPGSAGTGRSVPSP
jgi:hypothetical protein